MEAAVVMLEGERKHASSQFVHRAADGLDSSMQKQGSRQLCIVILSYSTLLTLHVYSKVRAV